MDIAVKGCLKWRLESWDNRRITRLCDLPEKLVAEIMSWLPPKYLLQLKCVQKSWYALIGILVKSQWFVAKHLKNSESNPSLFLRSNPPYIMPHPEVMNEVINSFMIFNKEHSDNDRICFDIKEFNMPESIAGECGSHCNGILFLPETGSNKVLLCNLAIREFKLLQSSCFGSNFKKRIMAGFGYDAIADVYKVVRVVRLHSASVGPPYGAEVCTLGSDLVDSWREIKMTIEINDTFYTCDEVYHKGICYWVRHCNGFNSTLIWFDLHEEEFQIVPLPGHQEVGTPSTSYMNWKLCLWGERLTLFFRPLTRIAPYFTPKPIKMWMLDESSGSCQRKSFRWTKYGEFLPGSRICYHPLTFWKSDELLMLTPQSGRVCSHNLRTKKLKKVQLNARVTFMHFRTILITESLVSMAGAKKMLGLS